MAVLNASARGYAGVVAVTIKPRRVREFVDAYVENDLLTYSSAISFQILSSLVPLLLFGFGMLGFLELEDVWRNELGPDVEGNVSEPAFALMNDVIERTLRSKQVFWFTAGFLIALWEVSGAMRAVMGALNRLYGDETKRSWGRRMLVSFALALAVGACWLAAFAVVVLSPMLYGDTGPLLGALMFVVRWGIAAAILLAAVGLLLHYAPEREQPLHWVSFGSLLIMAGWIVMSIGFGVYLRDIADYNSIFGGLATVVVLIAYLYGASLVFLGGVQIDALVRRTRG
jgi:membrane protein